jgi:hypothetical protein
VFERLFGFRPLAGLLAALPGIALLAAAALTV